MALQVLRTKFGRWLSNRQSDSDFHGGPTLLEDTDGGTSQILRRQEDGSDVVDSLSAVQKKNRVELFEQGLNRMIEKLDGINENLNRQNQQNGELIRRIDRLPELMDTLPSAVEGQKRVVEALIEELKTKALKDQQFAEVVAKIPVETARQSNMLAEMNRKMSISAEVDTQIAENLNRFNDTLGQLDEDTVSQTEGILQMTRTFAESDRTLKEMVRQQNRRFTWVFALSVGICILAGAALAVTLALVLKP